MDIGRWPDILIPVTLLDSSCTTRPPYVLSTCVTSSSDHCAVSGSMSNVQPVVSGDVPVILAFGNCATYLDEAELSPPSSCFLLR